MIVLNENVKNRLGSWAFVVGCVLAIVTGGLIQNDQAKPYVIVFMACLGLVVGIMNITARESTPFLVAAIALTVSSSAMGPLIETAEGLLHISLVGALQTILNNVTMFVAPAALVVAGRAIYAFASEK